MEWYHVYLFTRLDGLHEAFCVAAVITGGLAGAGACFLVPLISDFGVKPVMKGFVPLVLSTMFFVVGALAIPTQKEAAAIYLLPKLAKSEFASEASKIPVDAAKLLRLKLEEYISEIDPAKETKK